MSSILEEEECEEGSGSSSGSSDSEDDADFVPSAWDSQATPSRSALRSPDKKVVCTNNYYLVQGFELSLLIEDKNDFVFACCI